MASTTPLWRQALMALGIDFPDDSRGVVECPVCRGGMVVYQDNTPASVWLVCDCCSFRGSSLRLASRLLNLVEEAVVARLASVLGNRLGQADIDRQAEAWQKELLRRRAVDELLEKPVRSRAHQAAGVQYWPSGVPWQGLPSSLVGWYQRKDVEALLGPLGRSFEQSIKEVAVAPLHGPPGRVDGLWVWAETRQGNRELVRPIQGQRLPGCLVCRQGLDQAQAGQPSFLFGRPRDALYLQVRRLAAGESLLPVAGTDLTAGDLLPILGQGRDLVLWTSGVLDERLLRQARLLQARVARVRVEQENLSSYLGRKRLSEVDFLHRLVEGARDWRTALEATVSSLPESRVFAFLSGVGLPPSEIDEFARDLPGELGDSLRRAAEGDTRGRPVVLGGRAIEETPEGWKNATGALISSAVLRIEEVVRLGQRNQLYYRGKVRSSGLQHDFEVEATELDEHPASWLDRFLTARGDVLVHDPAWGRRLGTLARHFHKPVVVEACDRVGWDNLHRAFRFPRWSLFDGGTVTSCTTRPPALVKYPYDPEPPSEHRLECKELPRTALALLLAVIVDLVLPAIGGNSSGVTVGTRHPQLLSWLPRLGLPADSEMVRLEDDITALAHGASGGRHVLLPGAPQLEAELLDEAHVVELAALVPAYLRDLAQRRFRFKPRHSTNRLQALCDDIVDWARRHGVASKEVREIFGSDLRLDGSRTAALRCFTEMLAHLLEAGALSVVPERFYDPAENRLVFLARGRFWLPTDTIDRVLVAGDRIAIGHERMAKLLLSCPDAAGVLETIKGRRGVSVVESWWTMNVWRLQQAHAS